MGDILHALPAIEDAAQAIPELKIDWVVEEAFAEIPKWHRAVKKVIPVGLRRWKRAPRAFFNGEVLQCISELRKKKYDLVIDGQGLLKSAVWTKLARAKAKHGLDRASCREALASLAYDHQWPVAKEQHAVSRLRILMAQALAYACPDLSKTPLYGLNFEIKPENYTIFLHASSWKNKHWPIEYWRELGQRVNASGLEVLLPWGSLFEKSQAEKIAEGLNKARVLERLRLTELASVLAKAKSVVAVDTGLGHLAAALGVPCVSIYGPTDPKLTGTMGLEQHHIAVSLECAPCLSRKCKFNLEVPPCFNKEGLERVWQELQYII